MASIELPLKICHTKVLLEVDERLNHASREGGRPAPATALWRGEELVNLVLISSLPSPVLMLDRAWQKVDMRLTRFFLRRWDMDFSCVS